jgi:hypothetical protein
MVFILKAFLPEASSYIDFLLPPEIFANKLAESDCIANSYAQAQELIKNVPLSHMNEVESKIINCNFIQQQVNWAMDAQYGTLVVEPIVEINM